MTRLSLPSENIQKFNALKALNTWLYLTVVFTQMLIIADLSATVLKGDAFLPFKLCFDGILSMSSIYVLSLSSIQYNCNLTIICKFLLKQQS